MDRVDVRRQSVFSEVSDWTFQDDGRAIRRPDHAQCSPRSEDCCTQRERAVAPWHVRRTRTTFGAGTRRSPRSRCRRSISNSLPPSSNRRTSSSKSGSSIEPAHSLVADAVDASDVAGRPASDSPTGGLVLAGRSAAVGVGGFALGLRGALDRWRANRSAPRIFLERCASRAVEIGRPREAAELLLRAGTMVGREHAVHSADTPSRSPTPPTKAMW